MSQSLQPDGPVTPCILLPMLGREGGGLNRSVRERANFLTTRFDRVVVFTFDYHDDFLEIISELRASGRLAPTVEVRNFFHHFAPLVDEEVATAGPEPTTAEPGYVVLPDEVDPGEAYWYVSSEGAPAKRKRFRDGVVVVSETLDPCMRPIQRDRYSASGRLVLREQIAADVGRPMVRTIFRPDGAPLATMRVRPTNGALGRTFVFGPSPEDLPSGTTLVARWIDGELESIPNPVLLCDQRGKGDPVFLQVTKAARRIAVLHSSHRIPSDPTGGVRGIFANLLDRAQEIEQVVVLTQQQTDDLGKEYPDVSFTQIGHPANEPELAEWPVKDPDLVVYVGQLVDMKRIDHVIRAFASVVQEFPTARLEIYGEGPERPALERLIDSLALTASVTLMGYSLDAAEAQARAVCTTLTSEWEGWGLVLTESMAVGTPVVSYDIDYGPRDIIRDGVDGLIVEQEPEALARGILSLLRDPERARQMSSRARDVVTRFSREEYERKWVELLTTPRG